MGIKVSELEGQLLDDWVARAQGWIDKGRGYWGTEAPGTIPDLLPGAWHPSTNWNQGGPIIHRERIGTADDSPIGQPGTEWIAAIDLMPSADGYGGASFDAPGRMQRGATPLIAAMRAYVASKFGEEVLSA